jgi:hypothetical protein
LRDVPSAGTVVKSNGGAFGDGFRPERKIIVLLQELMLPASDSKAVAFACRALPEITKPTEIAVCERLKQENLDFMNRRPMTALGDDFVDDAAAGAPQFV